MHKVNAVRFDNLKSDCNFIEQLEATNGKLEDNVWNSYCVKKDRKGQLKKFLSHPKYLSSEDTSETSNISDVRIHSATSPKLGHNLELLYYNEKIHKPSRRQLVKNKSVQLHQGSEDGSVCEMEVGFGDGNNQKPVRKSVQKLQKKSTKTDLLSVDFAKKFKTLSEKSVTILKDIKKIYEQGVDLPDGSEDASRRLNRVKEFASRFSRNYLYPLLRQLEQLEEIENNSPNKNANANQKLISTYNIVLNGLQVFNKHLPTTIGSGAGAKLQNLLHHLLKILNLHENLTPLTDDFGIIDFLSDFKTCTELVLLQIEENCNASVPTASETVVIAKSKAVVSNPTRRNSNVLLKPQKRKPAGKLAMYTNTFRTGSNLHKAVEILAKKKYNVKSRYKTAGIMQPIKLPPLDALSCKFPSKCKIFAQKSNANLRKVPMNTPMNDDNVSTLIEIENEKEVNRMWSERLDEEPREEQVNHEDIAIKLYELVRENPAINLQDPQTSESGAVVEENFRGLLQECLKSAEGKQILEKLMYELTNDRKVPQLEFIETPVPVIEEKPKKARREPKMTVSGTKNVQFVCIEDDNSIVIDEDENLPHDLNLKCAASETQTDVSNTQIDKSTQKPAVKQQAQKSVKISRIEKKAKCLEMLEKDYAVNVIQYKLDFQNYCKSNPLYIKTENVQPWTLMGKISDDILDETLLAVAREIELNDVVSQIYQEELQL